ncbi:Major facilitator superfamily domain, general substrate transporter [Metarhizium rileyi]|uniref:Major facilitator superfamily domain, general substrate transporter n=1 Tax=Metarhizium rileyi (strain RCEF 4871) TaxID=1649241 RepID=A0A167FQQ0_METRR|nr:Major facilitator superfamily domain, general substrate transporter [Metarhizium rileyi RCEF 4871]
MGFFSKAEPAGIAVSEAPQKSESDAQHVEPTDATGNRLNNGKVQSGVARIEATTKVWSRSHLMTAYVMIWFLYFVKSIEEVVVFSMDPFVTSAFNKHSITPAIDVVAIIVGGLSYIPLAKILDTWGRPQGLTLTVFIWVIGLIMMAACNNVETFAAAKVFNTVGSQGVSYCVTIFIADTSSLLNRPLMLAFATSPYIVTTWVGGPVTESVLSGPGWRWGFGIWTIITPVVILPLSFLFLYNDRKAVKAGLIEKRTGWFGPQDVRDYIIAVDLVGIILLAGGMALFLLPFSIWSYQAEQWRAPLIICMLVFGAALLVVFVLWEKFFAPVSFIPYDLLLDRTVFSAGLSFVFIYASSSIWGGYFYSMLLVVWDTGVTKATYINNIYRVGSCFASVIIGLIVHRVGKFKWISTYYALPLTILGVGLMIKFRQASEDIGYVIMTQIFIAFAGGPMVVAGEMAMMAPSDHQHVAVIMAMLNLFCSIGAAIGSTISSAMWTGIFRNELMKNLPPGSPIDEIYGQVTEQIAYPVGSDMRNGISEAYSQTQRYMLITSVCLLVVGWGCTWLWRDIKLNKIKQVSGTVV